MKSCFRIMKFASLAVLSFFFSCSDSDYADTIPSNSVALMSVDVSRMNASGGMSLLAQLFQVDDLDESGLDFGSKVYAFETIDGNFGMCAKVADSDALSKCIENQAEKGKWAKITERDGLKFTSVASSWVVGFSDNAMLIIGPATVAAQPEVRRWMTRYFKQSKEGGITSTKLFERIDTMTSPMALVAQCSALPDKLVAPFTLGVPADADLSRVLVAAEMHMENGCLNIAGETFSFDKDTDEAIKKSFGKFRGIGSKYVSCVSEDAAWAFFANVKGSDFLPMVQANKSLQACWQVSTPPLTWTTY